MTLTKELGRIDALVIQKIEAVESLKEKIKESEGKTIDKDEIIKDLSENLYTILKDFKFPKLEEAYISDKNYLPYVRDRLYSELGSLAAVTLITMAYYLDIAVNSIGDKFNHLGILIIDSPRKNLGSQSTDTDFKDEEIFNSIIKTFIKIAAENEQELQLVVVNNGSPVFLNEDNIIVRFDGDGTKGLPYGLIDDI